MLGGAAAWENVDSTAGASARERGGSPSLPPLTPPFLPPLRRALPQVRPPARLLHAAADALGRRAHDHLLQVLQRPVRPPLEGLSGLGKAPARCSPGGGREPGVALIKSLYSPPELTGAPPDPTCSSSVRRGRPCPFSGCSRWPARRKRLQGRSACRRRLLLPRQAWRKARQRPAFQSGIS